MLSTEVFQNRLTIVMACSLSSNHKRIKLEHRIYQAVLIGQLSIKLIK